MPNHTDNNKRIAKNTFILYFRMLFLMAINLYTSRVILKALGVEDFGIYNVVGGFVALFAVISNSLSTAASRFLTYEMGTGDFERLKRVFSATLFIHGLLAMFIILGGEIAGLWFVNEKMVISSERLSAANWVFHFSVLIFCCNLVTVPFRAAIIAHEEMSAFAYISIFDGLGKLGIALLVNISPIDRLVFYAFMMFMIDTISRLLYLIYSRKHYLECGFCIHFDKKLFKEIFHFASWNIIGASSVILRNQGGNILINLFAGPIVNAARAIANQVLHAVHSFVDNFYMALRPQITKSYANGDRDYMMKLIYIGSRFSFYMLLILCLPIILNVDYLLSLWLKEVPDHTSLFVQLTLLFTLIESFSSTLITAQLATGKVKTYQLIVGGIQLLNIPVSYVLLKLGGAPETILYVAIFFSICCLFARLFMLQINIHLDAFDYFRKVVMKSVMVSVAASIVPIFLSFSMGHKFVDFFWLTLLCLVCSILSVLYIGCDEKERHLLYVKIIKQRSRIM